LTGLAGFTGIYEGSNLAATGSELEPPDQGMAVNAGVVGEVVNNTIQFFKSGQPLTAPLNRQRCTVERSTHHLRPLGEPLVRGRTDL
jgi:hypothetical protein